MFTGLIEVFGTVHSTEQLGTGQRLTIIESTLAPQLTKGQSVAVNGACLTVVQCKGDRIVFEVSPETLQRTNLGVLKPGQRVNLERSLCLGDRLDGHMVQGHVDGVGSLAKRQMDGDWELVWFGCPEALAVQMVAKGSVAVDGVSLTVVESASDRFSVALIPHTRTHTTLGFKDVGDPVNIETDLIAKYVYKYMVNIAAPKRD